jgi:predicted MFS family arabinose efflux permease
MKRPSAHALWHHPPFVFFWVGESVSVMGTQVTVLALPVTAIVVLHGTAFQLGLIRFLELGPFLLCALLFGAWSDRHRRKPLLLFANATRCMLISVIPVLALLHRLQFPILAVVALGIGLCTVLFDVTWYAFVPRITAPIQQVEAIGLVTASATLAEVAGPGIAGVLIQWLAAPLALVLDACSYAVATLSLLAIRIREPKPVHHSPTALHLVGEMVEGARHTFHNPYLRAIALMAGCYNLLSTIVETIFLLYVITERHLTPTVLGTTFAIGATGGVIGSAVATRVSRRPQFGPLLIIAACFACFPPLLLPAVSGPIWFEIGGFSLAWFLTRAGNSLWSVLTLGLRQALTPPSVLGRVSASIRTVTFGLGAVGALLSGAMGSAVGFRTTLWLAAVGMVGVWGMVVFATPLAQVRSIPTPKLSSVPHG